MLVKLLMLSGLIVPRLSMRLKVTFEVVLSSIRRPRLVVLSLVANFMVVPMVTIGLLYLFDAQAKRDPEEVY
jgi:predicted Na+-dependent transporter